MFLSNRDLRWAISCGHLIVEPRPEAIGPTSIDLHLDQLSQAKVWDLERYGRRELAAGRGRPELHIGKFDYRTFSKEYLTDPPKEGEVVGARVFLRGKQVVVQPLGFLLWQTKEKVGTPEQADLICFVEGKSTRSRTGLLVHLTAPTIHSTWVGQVTLEIVNLGPFDFVIEEDDVIAQLTVARITSVPDLTMKKAGSVTLGQTGVTGSAGMKKAGKKPGARSPR